MATNVYRNTEEFENALSDYTGAPYVVALDNMSNALFLALYSSAAFLSNSHLNTYVPVEARPIFLAGHSGGHLPLALSLLLYLNLSPHLYLYDSKFSEESTKK
jgi:hypothetical protein